MPTEDATEIIRKVLELCNVGLQLTGNPANLPNVLKVPIPPDIVGDLAAWYARNERVIRAALTLLVATGQIQKKGTGKNLTYYNDNGFRLADSAPDNPKQSARELRASKEDERQAAEDAPKSPFADIDEKRGD